MKMLVTGGAGFIGSHIAKDLLEMGHAVIILDDLSGGFKENLPQGAEFIQGDICDEKLINGLFQEYQFDYVYHFAAYAAEGLSHFIRRYNYNNNLIGSINLINASVNHKIKCFVYASSIAVYGQQSPPFSEETLSQPCDPYGISKYAVEMDLSAAHQLWGLDYIIFRPHNVYGENQNIGDKYRNVIGIFMNQILKGEPLTVFGDGNQTRAFTYIKDISSVMANSVFVDDARNQTFNIGADQEYTVNDLAKAVLKIMGADIPIKYLQERHEAFHAFSNHEKVQKMFNYKPMYSLEEGLKIMVDWVYEIGSKKGQKFSNIEVTENLPPIWRE